MGACVISKHPFEGCVMQWESNLHIYSIQVWQFPHKYIQTFCRQIKHYPIVGLLTRNKRNHHQRLQLDRRLNNQPKFCSFLIGSMYFRRMSWDFDGRHQFGLYPGCKNFDEVIVANCYGRSGTQGA